MISRAPVRIDRTLVVSVFIVASCGLAYELVSAALASYLLGDSVLQFSTVIGVYLFAMGIGSHLTRHIDDDASLERFIDIELLVGVVGGFSAALLFVVYGWLATPFRSVLYALVLLIGILVGMEIPLVMRVLHRQQAEFRELVSRVLAFDYLGALAVSLLFPLVLAPQLGLVRTGLLFGLLNVGVGWWTAHRFAAELPAPGKQMRRAAVTVVLLLAGFAFADRLTTWSEQQVLGDPIIHAETTPFQRLVVTRWKDDTRLYINGNLQFSSRDEHRYHEALVHPALAALAAPRRVLVLGGGDGMAVREILKYDAVREVTLVDLDPAMTRLFKDNPELARLNAGALADARVTIVNADAARWLEDTEAPPWDLIVADFPDPSSHALGKLYSVPIYRMMARHLAADGLLVVQATSPWYAPHAFWCIEATLRAAGFAPRAYHAQVPSFGEWGFFVAAPPQRTREFVPPGRYPVPLRFVDAAVTTLMFHFPADMPRPAVEPNRLDNQILVHYFEQDWAAVIR